MDRRQPSKPTATWPDSDFESRWQQAGLPLEECSSWKAVMSYRSGAFDDAVALARHKWTPADVLRARSEPEIFASTSDSGTPQTEYRIARLALLAAETMRYHQHQARVASVVREQFIADLANGLGGKGHWSITRIASLVGLGPSRVSMILNSRDYRK